MHNTRKIKEDIYYIGANDRRISLFERVFPISRGVSYNSYLVMDEKTVLLDTVDQAVSKKFLENLAYVLDNRKLDYLIVNHMEPDHCATMNEVVSRYPEVKIVANKKTLTMIKQFFDFDIDSRFVEVAEGSELCTGKHCFSFLMAPMVHWPEVMVTYDSKDRILFSADAFGTFGALDGNIFADEIDFEKDWLPDARRYYTNIVGKYGMQVQALLKKAAAIDIETICPLHGPIWRENLSYFIDKYDMWSKYIPEEQSVMIVYASIYGDTENAVEILSTMLAEKGIKNIAVYDISVTDPSVIISEAFRCSNIVFASVTYNAEIFPLMQNLILDIKSHNLQGRKVSLIENGTWAVTCGKQMHEILESLKGTIFVGNTVAIKSSVKSDTYHDLLNLADDIVESLK